MMSEASSSGRDLPTARAGTEPDRPGSATSSAPVTDPLHAMVASPTFAVDGRCFAARESGLERSTDGGKTWTSVRDVGGRGSPSPVTCVAFAPIDTIPGCLFAGALGGVMRSSDDGQTWRVAVLPTPPPLVSCLAVSPAFTEDGVVFAGTLEDGIVQSSDRGHSWRRWNFGLLDLGVLAIAVSPTFASDETVYAGTETGLFVSTNGGRAWRETGFPEEAAPVLSLGVPPCLSHGGVVWAGTEHSGLWRSSDGGQTWTRLDYGGPSDAINQIVVAPSGHWVLVAMPTSVLLTRDDGTSWTLVAEASGGGGIAAVAAPEGLDPGAPILLAQRNGTLRRVKIPNDEKARIC